MEIKNIAYDKNKLKALEKLAEYYQEQLTEGNTNANNPSDFIKTNEELSLVLEDQNQILGRIYGVIDLITSSVRIEGLVIKEAARGTGAGRKMVEEFERIAKSKNCQMSFVDTTSSSAPRFYEKLGYSLIGEVSDYPVADETYYFYMKCLT